MAAAVAPVRRYALVKLRPRYEPPVNVAVDRRAYPVEVFPRYLRKLRLTWTAPNTGAHFGPALCTVHLPRLLTLNARSAQLLCALSVADAAVRRAIGGSG